MSERKRKKKTKKENFGSKRWLDHNISKRDRVGQNGREKKEEENWKR